MKKLNSKAFNATCKVYCDNVCDTLRSLGVECRAEYYCCEWVVRFKISEKRNLYGEFFRRGGTALFDCVNIYEGYGYDLYVRGEFLEKIADKIAKLIKRLDSIGCNVFSNSLTVYVGGRNVGNTVNPLQWMLF